MEVRVVHVPSCATEHRTGHGMEHRTEGMLLDACFWDGSKESRRPSDYVARALARVGGIGPNADAVAAEVVADEEQGGWRGRTQGR